jgi:hypothetical protein
VTVEDRLRAATRARVELVREVRPLEVPDRMPRRWFRAPRPRRLIGWLVPVTAAAVAVALAIVLVSVRQVRNDAGFPGPAKQSATSAATIPRYYVSVGPGVVGASPAAATVGDIRTSAVVASVSPPAHRMFVGVAGAADDRTFVLDTVPVSGYRQGSHVWYLLRLAAGTGQPAPLKTLPAAGPPLNAEILGFALSPDGRTLAVLFQPGMLDFRGASDVGHAGPAAPLTLRTYSLASGQALRTWTTPLPQGAGGFITPPGNIAALSWTDDRTLAFRYPIGNWPDYVKMLNTAANGSDFIKASQSVLADPSGRHRCDSLRMATDGRTVVCGTLAVGGCAKEEPEFDMWSTATGALTQVLYRYAGTCQVIANADVFWAGPDGTLIGQIAANTYIGTQEHTKITVVLISHGRSTPLHISVPAYGAIAF